MSSLITFKKGGVHPSDKKYLSNRQEIKRLPLPAELVVAMSQHLGAPATLIKSVGDKVEKGEKIGEASSFVSANVHSPVRGTITEIKKVTLASGMVCDAAVIQPDQEQPALFKTTNDYKLMEASEILSKIKECGVVGMGGATFPTHVKMSVPEGKHVDALVINAVECEPYLTSDHRTLLERTDMFLEGIMICAKVLNPDKIIVGVECNKMDAIEHLNNRITAQKLPIEVKALKMKYPQGDEKQLLKATIGREIPSGKLPIDIGGVVVNTGSVIAIYEAIKYGKPVFERIITVSGECVAHPCNVLAPVGTKVSDLIEFAGGFKEEPDKLISGGPMMGFAFIDMDTPVCKGTSGIIAIKDKKDHKQTNCLSCGHCVMACPIGLEPTRLYAYITNGRYEDAMKEHLMDCKECGCCAFSCPAHLDLVHAFKMGKKLGRKK